MLDAAVYHEAVIWLTGWWFFLVFAVFVFVWRRWRRFIVTAGFGWFAVTSCRVWHGDGVIIMYRHSKIKHLLGVINDYIVGVILFHGPLLWLSRRGNRHLWMMQMMYLFSDEKPSLFCVFGLANRRRLNTSGTSRTHSRSRG